MANRPIRDEVARAISFRSCMKLEACPADSPCFDCLGAAALACHFFAERLREWRAQYPEDVFRPDGTTPDAYAAKGIRHVLDAILADLEARNLAPDERET